MRAGQPCAQRDPGTTLAPSVQTLQPVRVEHVQGEESDDEVALSRQYGKTTTEIHNVRALDATLGAAGVEQTSVQIVQRGQASVSDGVVVLDRPVRSLRGGRGLMPGGDDDLLFLYSPQSRASDVLARSQRLSILILCVFSVRTFYSSSSLHGLRALPTP